MSEPVIVDRVTKRFSGHTAVDGLSLSVAPGTIYGGSSEIQRNILAKYVLKLPG